MKFLLWLIQTVQAAVKSAKAAIAVVVPILVYLSTSDLVPENYRPYIVTALVILSGLGVTAARRQYGIKDAPVGVENGEAD